MTQDARRTACPEANLLAAYMDGGLEVRERAEIEEHLVECEECYEVVTAGTEHAPMISAPRAATLNKNLPLSWKAAAVAAVFVASTVTALWWFNQSSDEVSAGLDALFSAARTERFSEARLSGREDWAPPPSATRASTPVKANLKIQEAAVRLRIVFQQQQTGRTSHAAGIALLAIGEIDDAVDTLQRAVDLEPANTSYKSDLAAALIERNRVRSTPGDARQALELIASLLELGTPSDELRFNKALALEAIDLPDVAIAAWREYLAKSPKPAWAAEAQRHISELGGKAPHSAGNIESGHERNALEGSLATWVRQVAADGIADKAIVEEASLASAQLEKLGVDSYPALITSSLRTPEISVQVAKSVAASLEWYELTDIGDHVNALKLASAALGDDGASSRLLEPQLQRAYSSYALGETRYLASVPRLIGVARERGFHRLAAIGSRILSVAAMGRADAAASMAHTESGLADALKSRDPDLIALFETAMSEALFEHGDADGAAKHLALALKQLPHARGRRRSYETLAEGAWQARSLGLPHVSLIFAQSLLGLARNWKNDEGRVTAFLEVASAQVQLMQREAAAVSLAQANDAIAAYKGSEYAKRRLIAEAATYRAYLLADQNRTAAIASATEALTFFQDGFDLRVVELLLVRGRLFRDSGQVGHARADWERAATMLDDQRPSIRSEQLRIARTAKHWAVYVELIRSHLDSPSEALSASERGSARELLHSLDHHEQVRTIDVNVIRRSLKPGGLAVVFRILPEAVLRWTINAEGIRLASLPYSEVDINRAAAVVSATPGVWQPGSILDHLLPPEALLNSTEPLLVVPDGPLGRLPFAELPMADGRALIDARPVTMGPSLTAAWLANQTGRAVRRSVSAIAVTDPSPGRLPRLRHSGEEALAIASRYATSKTLLDEQATAPAVLATFGSDVIHIATHATIDTNQPQYSKLWLTNSTSLAPADISDARSLKGAVVVLGACASATGRISRGEGAISLARSFLAAGAHAVIAPLWDIADAESVPFLVSLHTELAAGTSPSTALRKAQLQAKKNGVAPSVWGAFVVIGSFTA